MIFYNIIKQLESSQNIGHKPGQGEKWKKFSTLEKFNSTYVGKVFHLMPFTAEHAESAEKIFFNLIGKYRNFLFLTRYTGLPWRYAIVCLIYCACCWNRKISSLKPIDQVWARDNQDMRKLKKSCLPAIALAQARRAGKSR